MNQRQREQIREEIEKRRREHPEMEEFFRGDRTEPFFVKNIEMVQGDERDVIFLSVGYAPSPDGDLAMRFGPLNIAGGERRLNVAISCARWAITVVSSIRAGDIDLSRTKSKGAALLRTYLDFAERGMDALKSAISDDGSRQPDSPFEIAVARELEKRGFQVRRQVGCGRYWIDLALVHPKQPGCYVLGIECDGAMYHSSATARPRSATPVSIGKAGMANLPNLVNRLGFGPGTANTASFGKLRGSGAMFRQSDCHRGGEWDVANRISIGASYEQ